METFKILLVDDERSEREGVSFLIERYGYPLEIKQAPNGQKALEIMKKESFDILFTDAKMPVMDGLTLAKEVAKNYMDTIIIIFSAYSEFEFAKKAMEAGVVNYLLKPVEVDEFQKCMESVIEKLRKNRTDSKQSKKQQEMVHEALLYRFFRSRNVLAKDADVLKNILFEKNKEGCILSFFKFVDNYFEYSAEGFLKMAKAYFKSVTFSQMLSNEGYLVIHNTEYKDPGRLKVQLDKLLEALKNRKECLVIVSENITSLEDLMRQLEAMDEIQKNVFWYRDRLLFVGDCRDGKTVYARNIEEVKKDVFKAIESQEADRIREGCAQLCHSLTNTNELSRIYIQHLLYSIVKELYDKMPQVEYEDVLNVAGEFFTEKKPEKLLRDFLNAVDRILTTAAKDSTDYLELIGRIKRFIQKDYKSNLSLVDVAEAVNLTPAYVSHIFKKETGQGIVEYITELKMKKAKQLLEDKNLKIIQIAKICGYENQSYFNKLFKIYYGMTPKQYREEL